MLRQASFLDPRFKDLPFTSEESLDKTKKELLAKVKQHQEKKSKQEPLPTPPPQKKSNWKSFGVAEDFPLEIGEARKSIAP